MLTQLNHDILCHLSNYFLSFDSLINLSSSCKYLYSNIYSINLYDVECKYSRKLTDPILKQQKYIHVRYLDAQWNYKISNVNHMQQLRELRCESGINQDGIRELFNLEILDVSMNEKITDVNHMQKLRELRCGFSEINQDGIRELFNLEILDVTGNEKISNVNHMQKLRELRCYGNSGINQNGIRE